MADVDPSAFLKAEKNTGEPIIQDFKKCVWVPDDQEGFVAATIKEQTGDVVTLELSNGSVSSFYINHLIDRIITSAYFASLEITTTY